MFENVIIEQNLHWTQERYPEGVKRNCFPKLLDYLTTTMIVSIIGIRRAGKSTLLKQVINHLIAKENVPAKNILFLNLEHPYFAQYSKDIKNLQHIYEDYLKIANPSGTIYCLLDEVQFFDNWPVFVKAHYEQKKVKLIITGSNSALLSSDLLTLLSGRTLSIEVFPLSFQELAHAHNITSGDAIEVSRNKHVLRDLFEHYLQYGGFPEVILKLMPSVAYDILNAYAKTILYQDVTPRLQLRKPLELERLFVYLMSNIGKPFSYANLSALFDLSDKVIKGYIEAFSESFLLFELDVFDYSLKKQIRNPKKIYSIDTGQVNAVAFHFTQNKGRLLENLVFLELRRLGLETYYYKTKNNLEIDFVAKKQMVLSLIQVSWSLQDPQTCEREQKALIQALNELHLTHGIIITENEEDLITLETFTITVIPAYKFFCLSEKQKIELLFPKQSLDS